jgi:DUF4097 and DUF4098 domain-containing protein YvlB
MRRRRRCNRGDETVRNRVSPVVAAVVVACLHAGASADGNVEERRPLDADGIVSVKNINGSITVEGWAKNELEVTGKITGDVEEVSVTGSPSRMRVEVRFPERHRNLSGSADLHIKLPAGAGLRVDVVNADVTVAKLNGDVDLQAVNGDMVVSGQPKQVSAKTVNGLIQITSGGARIEAETVGGRIVLEGAEGDVAAASVGGDIEIRGGRLERARFTSVSGSVDVTAELAANATLEADGHSGDVILTLPANVSAEFDVSTFSGDIQNDFGPPATKNKYGPGRELTFATGGGDAQVNINTFSGDVRLLKK